jgi:hypothetical protein
LGSHFSLPSLHVARVWFISNCFRTWFAVSISGLFRLHVCIVLFIMDAVMLPMLTTDPIAELRARLIRRRRWYCAPYRLFRWLLSLAG